MELTETFQVACIIDKLPIAWSIFKSYLEHKRKEMNMVELLVRINVQKQYMNVARGVSIGPMNMMTSARVNMVVHG